MNRQISLRAQAYCDNIDIDIIDFIDFIENHTV